MFIHVSSANKYKRAYSSIHRMTGILRTYKHVRMNAFRENMNTDVDAL